MVSRMRATGVRLLLVWACLAAVSAGLMAPATASVDPDAAADDASEQAGVRFVKKLQMPTISGAGTNPLPFVWTWGKGGRAFGLYGKNADKDGWPKLVAMDLDTLTPVGDVSLSPPGLFHVAYLEGQPTMGAVDEEGGRLFVAYETPNPMHALGTDIKCPPEGFGCMGLLGSSGNAVPRQMELLQAAAQGRVCGMVAGGSRVQCVGGVHVIDAATLAVRSIPLRLASVDGMIVAPHLRHMEFAPGLPGVTGRDQDKLLLVIEELSGNPLGVSDSGSTGVGTLRHAPVGGNLVYVVQLDVASGVQDWVVRVDACRYPREPRGPDGGSYAPRPHGAAVFRSEATADAAVYVACHTSNQVGVIVRYPLDGNGVPVVLPASPGDPGTSAGDPPGVGNDPRAETAGLVRTGGGSEVVVGPERTWEMRADPRGGKLLFRVIDGTPESEVWWVFDTATRRFVGTLGIGKFAVGGSASGFDPVSGRLYVLGAAHKDFAGGLFAGDVRRVPLGQPLWYPELATGASSQGVPLQVARAGLQGPALLYHRANDGVYVFADHDPVRTQEADQAYEGRTIDVDEIEGVTVSTFDGAARGYGVRALLVGGAEGAARVGPADPLGTLRGTQETNGGVQGGPDLPETPCVTMARELVVGFVGPDGAAVVDSAGARGGAEPVRVDSATRADLESPVGRCLPVEWEALWSAALFGRPPVGEPGGAWPFAAEGAACVSGSDDETVSSQVGDPVTGRFAARAECAPDEASGYGYARAGDLGGVTVGEALSSFRIYRDPGRGVVSVVESVARGVEVPGVLRIGTVRGRAESWANGRRQLVAEADRPQGYVANCDRERTAGTCFQRHLFGVWTPGYACGPCGDETAFVAGLGRALGNNAKVALREPEPVLARGSENGFIAAVQKPDGERFADMVLNNDLLQTVVPVLEFTRYAPTNPSLHVPKTVVRGRQVYQFAGVEVSSSYGITCLLVYDEVRNVCAAQAEPPGSVTVSLTDADGKPLAGGAFEVRADVDGDGVAGLVDMLVEGGACVTGEDGVGTCRFDALEPGGYLVSQVAAPTGHAKVDEPYQVELASGEARMVTFTNASNTSTIAVSAADEARRPVAGAVFAVFADPDADGKVAADATPAAACTTDASGSCAMQVPTGSWVLVQTAAPAGLEPIEPVAFALTAGGQTAAVEVVNYPLGDLAPPEPAAAPAPVVEYTIPATAPVTDMVTDYTAPGGGVDEPKVSLPQAIGGPIVRVIQAPGDALRLLAREPRQAAAWLATLALLALAAAAVRRREQALVLIRAEASTPG